MSGNSEPRKYKNPVLNWIEFRLPIISYFQKEYGGTARFSGAGPFLILPEVS